MAHIEELLSQQLQSLIAKTKLVTERLREATRKRSALNDRLHKELSVDAALKGITDE